MAERVGFEPTCRNYPTIRFRVGAVMTTSVPLQMPKSVAPFRDPESGGGILYERDWTRGSEFESNWCSGRDSRHRHRRTTGRLHPGPVHTRPDSSAERDPGGDPQYPDVFLLRSQWHRRV